MGAYAPYAPCMSTPLDVNIRWVSHIITAFVRLRYRLALKSVNLKQFCNNKECVFCTDILRKFPTDSLKFPTA